MSSTDETYAGSRHEAIMLHPETRRSVEATFSVGERVECCLDGEWLQGEIEAIFPGALTGWMVFDVEGYGFYVHELRHLPDPGECGYCGTTRADGDECDCETRSRDAYVRGAW